MANKPFYIELNCLFFCKFVTLQSKFNIDERCESRIL